MNVIITGSTGMVGKAVLLECLESNAVESILLINRNSLKLQDPKVKEVLHKDFTYLNPIKEHFSGFDACFFCMGVSALGMTEAEYSQITYSITDAFANVLHALNKDIIFNYVSGAGTDSSEIGRIMWARVKGKTENMILKHGFKDAYIFRPGFILPEKGIKSRTAWYNGFYSISRPFYPLLRKMGMGVTSSNVGQAMINSILFPQDLKVLENRDIKLLAEKPWIGKEI